MKYIQSAIIISLFLIDFYACKTIDKAAIKEVQLPIISISKSSCFGKCGVYNFSIFQNRLIKYEGKKHVENIGNFQSVLTIEQYESLINYIEYKKFELLKPTYLSGARDLQTIELTYNLEIVKFHLQKASESLLDILKRLELIIEDSNWVKE